MPTGSLSFIPKIFLKQKEAMLIEFAYITLRIIALAIGIYFKDFNLAIISFSAISTLVIGLQLLWYFNLIRKYEKERQ